MNERKYAIQFVRSPGLLRNRKNEGAFTKTFSTIDEVVRFAYSSHNIRIKGVLIDYFTSDECKIYFNKMWTVLHKPQ